MRLDELLLAPVARTPLTEDAYLEITGNPVSFLHDMLRMYRRRDRGEIGFDHKTLDWMARMWALAAMESSDNSVLRDKLEHERDRCRHWSAKLKAGMQERQDSGFVFFDDASDWPHWKTVVKAIRLFQRGQVGTIQ